MTTPGSKKRKRNFFDVKWLILSGALVSTLGFWGIFARLENRALVNAASDLPSQTPDPGSQATNVLTIQLPPMPTLAPAAISSAIALTNPDIALAGPAPVQAIAPAAPRALLKILLGGAKPGQGGSAPIARTRSSQ